MKEIRVEMYYKFKECSKCKNGRLDEPFGPIDVIRNERDYKCNNPDCSYMECLFSHEWPHHIHKEIK